VRAASLQGEAKVPEHEVFLRAEAKHPYVVYIMAFNERQRLAQQLDRFPKDHDRNFDIMLGDDGSTDGTSGSDLLEQYAIRGATRLKQNSGLSQNIKVALAWLYSQNYKGVIFMNGNNRDDPSAVPEFIRALDEHYGYVQGSRFRPGGKHANTPWIRFWAIRVVHAPLFSLACLKWMTDTTNGYRAFSLAFLRDHRVDPFQPAFVKYEIEQYLAWKAIRLGYLTKEIPVARVYSRGGFTSHIRQGMAGWMDMLRPLVMLLFRRYR
jgi:glycosyltransferase involved in cell wall biosynthesis